MGSKSRSNVTTSRRTGGQNSTHSNNDKSKFSVSKDSSSRNPRQMGREANSHSVKNLAKEPHNPHSRPVCSPTPTKGNMASNLKSSARPMTINPTTGHSQGQERVVNTGEMYGGLKHLLKAPSKLLNKRAISLKYLWEGRVERIAIDVPFGQERGHKPYYPTRRRTAVEKDEEENENVEDEGQGAVGEGEGEQDEFCNSILRDFAGIENLTNLFPRAGIKAHNHT
ncbi:unnamed protein product [Rhizoctonia solani]|uniref:Uncharacterized protein n=1 Tax=Rhizoctonia solani TaxID=456999 RepID=A0A8H3CV18_9AGAM|nr:unnamed protein product [Rhizoctonia solani]CAE6497277.1 unnamed protein product [Rhizoctonia solani]